MFNKKSWNIYFFHFKWIYRFFRIHVNFFNFSYVLQNTVFEKVEAITLQLLVQSPEKFLFVIWYLGTKTYPKFVTLRLFFKIFRRKNFFQQINKLIWNKKKRLPDYLWDNCVFWLFVNPLWVKLLSCWRNSIFSTARYFNMSKLWLLKDVVCDVIFKNLRPKGWNTQLPLRISI